MATNQRRQRIITDPELQRRIVASSVWPVVAAFTVMVASLGLVHWRMSASATSAGIELDGLGTTFFAAYLLSFSAAGFVLFHSLRLSHRIAGPLYRFRMTYREVRAGNLDARADLRSDDLLETAAADLNGFLDWVASTTHPARRNERAATDATGEGPTEDEAPAPTEAVATTADD